MAAAATRHVRLCAVSLAQLQYFVAVAETGSVCRAAGALHISQPPLSRQLRCLEEELGTALFERTPRGMKLLPAGEAFLSRVRRVLDDLNAAVRCVRQWPLEGGKAPPGVFVAPR